MRTGYLLAAVASVTTMVLMTEPALGAGSLPSPTWPQTFKLLPGRPLQFGFPMTQAGSVVVDLQWQGVPLTVGLKNDAGVAVGTTAQHAAPKATVTYALTATDVKGHCAWIVTLTAQGAGPAKGSARPAPVATGTISVKTPAVDAAALQPMLQALISKRTAQAQALIAHRRRTSAQVIAARVADLVKAQQDRLAVLDQHSSVQFQTQVSQHTGALKTAAAALLANPLLKRKVAPMSWTAPLHPVKLASTHAVAGVSVTQVGPVTIAGPSLVSVTPGTGSPGDEIAVDVGGVGANLAQLQVLFTIAPGVTVPGQIASYCAGTPTELYVAVPNAAGATMDYDGQIVVQFPDGSVSKPLAFGFRSIKVPVIYKTALAGNYAHPGDGLVVTGGSFQPVCQAFFVFPWTPQSPVAAAPLPSANVGTTTLGTVIPSYSSDVRFASGLFVRYHYKTKYLQTDVDSAMVSVTLDAARPTLSSLGCTSGYPGNLITVNGQGFGDATGEVHFTTPPNGQDVKATVRTWSDTCALVQVPDATGFQSPTNGMVYVKLLNGQKTAMAPWQFQPLTEYRTLVIRNALGADYTFVKRNGNDNWSYCHNSSDVDDGARIDVQHCCDFWHNNDGKDEWFLAFQLQGGWTVQLVDFDGDDYGVFGGAALDWKNSGTSPYVRVAWQTSACVPLPLPLGSYQFGVLIQGPKGVPCGDSGN